jgi:pyruvate,water dikinase
VLTSAWDCIVSGMLQSSPKAKLIASIADVCKDDVALVGGKGANLGEMTRAGIPVPPGFVVTVHAYSRLLDEAELREQAERLLDDLDINDRPRLETAAAAIRRLITAAEMPEDVASEIAIAYQQMALGAVAVRSSATAEDLAEASFAGQQETYLNVEGEAHVVRAVQNCWASLFEDRAIFYRGGKGFGQLEVGIAVVVQSMVQSDRSGVMFTVNPVTNDHGQVLIEAVYGLGEGLVSGLVTPDMYVVDKASAAVLQRQLVPQEQEFVRRPQGQSGEDPNHWVPIESGRRTTQKLSDMEIGELATLGRRLEKHFGCAQDIEWACESGSFCIVQSRAVTTAGAQ